MPLPDLSTLSVEDLRTAARVYVEHAYPHAEPPEAVRRRLAWPDGVCGSDLVTSAPFERASKSATAPVYALRLGNARYPHMKLQVQPWPCPAGYMLSVNTHDQILGLDPDAPDADAFRTLQHENQRIKEDIELAWDRAGLPTFLRYLRDYLEGR